MGTEWCSGETDCNENENIIDDRNVYETGKENSTVATKNGFYISETSHIRASCIGTHLITTSHKRKHSDGTITHAFLQGTCIDCEDVMNSKYTCYECVTQKNKDISICHSSTEQNCFTSHYEQYNIDN